MEEMRHRLSNQEYVFWQIYYARIAQRRELEVLKRRGK